MIEYPSHLTVVSGPAAEPLSLDEAKAHLRVSHDDEDDLITSIIKASRQQLELLTSRAFVTQTLRLSLSSFPAGNRIPLLCPPIQSVTSITYTDDNGATQTFSSALYRLIQSEPGYVELAYEQSWPTHRYQSGSVNVTFVAGYGGASAVPHAAKAALRLMIGELYLNREAAGSALSANPAVGRLVSLLKWGNYQ